MRLIGRLPEHTTWYVIENLFFSPKLIEYIIREKSDLFRFLLSPKMENSSELGTVFFCVFFNVSPFDNPVYFPLMKIGSKHFYIQAISI